MVTGQRENEKCEFVKRKCERTRGKEGRKRKKCIQTLIEIKGKLKNT